MKAPHVLRARNDDRISAVDRSHHQVEGGAFVVISVVVLRRRLERDLGQVFRDGIHFKLPQLVADPVCTEDRSDQGLSERSADIAVYSVGANLFSMFWAGSKIGWDQVGGKFFLEASAVGVEFAIVRIPAAS